MLYPTIMLSQLMSFLVVTNLWTSSLKVYLRRVYSVIEQLTRPNIYVFLENYPQPFPARFLSLENSHTAVPELLYDADTNIFFPYNTDFSYKNLIEEYKPERLPILSIEILDKDSTVIFDLTDFIDKIRYVNVSGVDAPELSEIISAWSIESYIILNKTKYIVRYISNDGEMCEVPLNALDELVEEEEEEEDVIIEDISGQAIESDDISIEELD